MRTLTKLLLKEATSAASSSATGAAAVASAASTSSRPRTPERRGSECDPVQHRTCSSSCSSPSRGGRSGAGKSDISNNSSDSSNNNGSLSNKDTKKDTNIQLSSDRRQPRQWTNTVSFLIQNVLGGAGSSAQRAKTGDKKFDAACLSNPPSPVSTPRRGNLGQDDDRTSSEQPEELTMGMACRARPILGPPLPLPDLTGTASSSRIASASARPFASTGSFSPASNIFLGPSSPSPSSADRPLLKAPTGTGGHVLYPEQPHTGKTREALLDIYGHAGEDNRAANKYKNNSNSGSTKGGGVGVDVVGAGEDDRILPSLVYDINWSLVRVVRSSPQSEAAASSGTATGSKGSNGAKGRRGGPSKKATVIRKANGEVVVNFPTTGGAAAARPPASNLAEGATEKPAEGTNEDLSFEDIPRRGFYPPTDSITEYLFDRFVPSHFDSQTYRWLKGKAIPSVPRGAASAWLQAFMSRTSANALTGRGEMFVVSRSQVVALIKKYDEGLMAERKAMSRRKHEAEEAKGRRNDDHHQRMSMSNSGEKSSFSPSSPSLLEPAEVAPAAYYYNSLRIPLLVDIGAGDGGATVEYSKNLFGVVGATEDNKAMQWRLWWRGFKVLDFPSCIKDSNIYSRLLGGGMAAVKKAHGAISNGGRTRMIKDASSAGGSLPTTAPPPAQATTPPSANVTTIIALMNVLDRADKPLSLLKGIVECMKQIDEGEDRGEEGSTLKEEGERRDPRALFMMAVVLPWCPFVETNTKKLPPSEPLPMDGGKCQERAHFETSLATLVERVLIPNGLEVVAWTRVPYLCEGSATHGYYRLDDAVLLMRRAPTSTRTLSLFHEVT